MNPEEDLKSLELALAKLEKQFGIGAVFYGNATPEKIPVIPTGNFKLDLALGVGGLPKGRITEVFGAETLGKSLLALNVAANCQSEGGRVAYIDAECDLDADWCIDLGVDPSKMIISQPEYGEEALEIAETLVKTGKVDLIVIDSVAALTPKAEIDGSMSDLQVGAQARLMAKGLRKLRQPVSQNNVCLLFLNQIRDKIGFMQSGTTSPGGRSLKFYSSVRIELKKMGEVKSNTDGTTLGTKVKAVILKNKVARPAISVEYNIIHGVGFDNHGMILEMGKQYGLIIQKGAYYYIPDNDKSFAQGERNACQYLKENPGFTKDLALSVMKSYYNE